MTFNCFLNHPCPIFCSTNLTCQGNEVVNPVLTQSFAFFSNNDVGAIETGAIIPLSLSQVSGDSISASTTTEGAINLLPGIYEVAYFAQGTNSPSSTISVSLELNGTQILGSEISQTLDVGSEVAMSKTIVISVAQESTLELVNNSSQTTTFDSASVFVRRL